MSGNAVHALIQILHLRFLSLKISFIFNPVVHIFNYLIQIGNILCIDSSQKEKKNLRPTEKDNSGVKELATQF